MKKFAAKLKSAAGETLTETLVAILIVALASMAFLSMSMAAGRINASAESVGGEFRDQLTAAESGGTSHGSVYIDGKSFAVDYSGSSSDTMTSYTIRGEG